ncbi:MAG: hypothetical protein KG012_14375 [Deltaproteobacteria bacterium]|nr:hypothetical protein [Deltaproteobacteria bacterium]
MNWIDHARKKREIAFEPIYGPIRPKSDSRCFRREMIEELLDAINYGQWSKEKGEINRQQWKRMDSGIRAVIRTIEAACADRFEWETGWT